MIINHGAMCPIPSFLPDGEHWTCECGNKWFKVGGIWRQYRIVGRPPTAAALTRPDTDQEDA